MHTATPDWKVCPGFASHQENWWLCRTCPIWVKRIELIQSESLGDEEGGGSEGAVLEKSSKFRSPLEGAGGGVWTSGKKGIKKADARKYIEKGPNRQSPPKTKPKKKKPGEASGEIKEGFGRKNS